MPYMKDSAGKRLDSFPVASSGGNAAILMQRLTLGQEDASLLVLGDSTGVIGASPWPLVVARWLAAQFPAYTVNYRVFDDASQTYLALGAATAYPTGLAPQTGSQVVQTGTGSKTLTIWNGSVSGAQATYPRTTLVRWTALVTTPAPQLILINFGHNTNGATDGYRSTHYPLCRNIHQALPEAGVVQVAQNPRASTDGEYSNDLIRARVVSALAATEGYGLVNVTRRFLATPSYATTLLLGDGLHPNDSAGSPAWADEVQQHLALGLRSVPRGPHNRAVELYLPATSFRDPAGTLVLAQMNAGNMAWALPTAQRSDLIASFTPPEHWSEFDIALHWSVATGNAAQVVAWGSATRAEGLGPTDVQLDGSVLAFPTVGTSGWSNNIGAPNYITKAPSTSAGAYPTYGLVLAQNLTPSSRPMGLKISRRADTGADTFTAAAYLLGVRLLRRR